LLSPPLTDSHSSRRHHNPSQGTTRPNCQVRNRLCDRHLDSVGLLALLQPIKSAGCQIRLPISRVINELNIYQAISTRQKRTRGSGKHRDHAGVHSPAAGGCNARRFGPQAGGARRVVQGSWVVFRLRLLRAEASQVFRRPRASIRRRDHKCVHTCGRGADERQIAAGADRVFRHGKRQSLCLCCTELNSARVGENLEAACLKALRSIRAELTTDVASQFGFSPTSNDP
jgi:hypothetical protein